MEENRYIIMINSKVIAENIDLYDAVEKIKTYILFPLTVKNYYNGDMTIRLKKMDNYTKSFTKEENRLS